MLDRTAPVADPRHPIDGVWARRGPLASLQVSARIMRAAAPDAGRRPLSRLAREAEPVSAEARRWFKRTCRFGSSPAIRSIL